MVFELNTNQPTLKEIALDIKDVIVNRKSLDVEKYIEELSNNSGVDFHDIKNIYNQMFAVYNSKVDADAKRRPWQSYEDSLIVTYTNMYKHGKLKEKPKPMRDVLNDLEDILLYRSDTSIAFRYYNVLNTKKKPTTKIKKRKDKPEKTFKPSLQLVEESKKPIDDAIVPDVKQSSSESNDLLDVVLEIVENVETAEVDVSALFSGILALSKKAVTSSNKHEIAELKSQLKKEIEEKELLKAELEYLKEDVELLKEEVVRYNNMSGKERLKNFHKYNDNIKYMVDKFGIVEVK